MMNFLSILNEKLTLEYHKKLNPIYWDGEQLKPQVKNILIKIGYKWAKFANVPEQAIMDIVMTGGNANYNYTNSSDLDIHLVVDPLEFNMDKEMLLDYFKDKKTIWSLSHKLKVYGADVEIFAQPITQIAHKDQGVYSLLHEDWISKPKFKDLNFEKDSYLTKKVESYMQKIDHLIETESTDETLYRTLLKKISKMRDEGLEKGGEFSMENLLFKELRARGYIDKLRNAANRALDMELTLE
jgi:hypothetical protein